MYYQGVPANGSQGPEKPGIYVPAQSPYGTNPSAYPQGAIPPPGLQQRFASPQAYAVVSNAGLPGYTTVSPSYASLAAYSQMQQMASASPTYISAGQYPGAVSYPHHQSAMGPRSMAPSPYGGPPLQAGAPLFAGYSAVPGAMQGAQTAAGARSYPVGAHAVAAYPPGYPLPQAGSVPNPYHGAQYGPPF